MKRFRTAAATFAAVALVLSACSDDKDSSSSADFTTISDGKLTVCTDSPYEPFEWQDDEGKWTGFDIDLLSAVAESMDGLTLEVIDQPFEGIWLAPAAKKCDVVGSAMTITEERQQAALFSDPYFNADQSLLVNADQAETLVDAASLAGKTIAVQTNTTGESYAKENFTDSTIKSFADATAMFLALESGQVDAAFQDLPVNADRAMKNTELAISATFTTGEQYGFAVAKDNDALVAAINAGLASAKSDGTYAEIYKGYFGVDPE
jgi:polar amino acid transport system substrate-binding protein